MSTVYYLCWDNRFPSGGDKKTYHHVEVLNRSGIDACVLHHSRGFRYTQFKHSARVSSIQEAVLQADDLLAVPEDHGPEAAGFAPGIRKVIWNQNAYYTFKNFPIEAPAPAPYLQKDYVATLVVSEDNRRYLEHVFPGIRVVRVHNAIDFGTFRHEPAAKKRRIAFMTRKHPDDVVQVVNILRFKGLLEGWELAPIVNKTEDEVAAIMRESLIFLSFGYPEGCPLSVAEAMACGCFVVGYHGMGGRELFDPNFSISVGNGEIVEFTRAAEEALRAFRDQPSAMAGKGALAAEFVRREYAEQRERDDLCAFWRGLLAS